MTGSVREVPAVRESPQRFYDPTTGQFLSRDPLNAVTRSAYGYVYGNPLNMSDPMGLWPDWGSVGQGIADFSGGVLNGITLGHADQVLDAVGRIDGGATSSSQVNHDSGLYKGGTAVGVALDVPLLVPQAGEAVGIEAFAEGSQASAAAKFFLGSDLTFGSRLATGFYGASVAGFGMLDIKNANDVCQASPGSSACRSAMTKAWFETGVGGLAGFFPGLGGLAALGFGLDACFNDGGR